MNLDLQKNQDLQLSIAESQTKIAQNLFSRARTSVKTELRRASRSCLSCLTSVVGTRTRSRPPARRRPRTSRRLRSEFRASFPSRSTPRWSIGTSRMASLPRPLRRVFSEEIWSEWEAQEQGKAAPKILAISGPPGSGKSHLAASA